MLLGLRTDRLCVSSRDSARSVRLRVFVRLGRPHYNDHYKHCQQAATDRRCHARVSNGVILNQSFPFSVMQDFSLTALFGLPAETLLQYDDRTRLQAPATIRGRFGE
jgi:hypothetical protein